MATGYLLLAMTGLEITQAHHRGFASVVMYHMSQGEESKSGFCECSYLNTQWAARIPDMSKPAEWATGAYFPYPYLNITGHVKVWSDPLYARHACMQLSSTHIDACPTGVTRPVARVTVPDSVPWTLL